MVLWLHWLSVIMNEWARNPLKCRGSGASGEGIHFLFPVEAILSFLSIFGQTETHPPGLFLMWHCLNADMSYLSTLDRSAVKAQLLTCPPGSPGAPHQGIQGRQGWASPGLVGWKEFLCTAPRWRAAHSQGSSSRLLGPGKCCCHMVLLEVQLKQNEGSWWIFNQLRLPHKEGCRIQHCFTNMLTNSLD